MNRTVHEGQYVIIDVQKTDWYCDYTKSIQWWEAKVWRVNMKFTVQCNWKLRRHTTSFEIMRLDDMKKLWKWKYDSVESYKKHNSWEKYAVYDYNDIYNPLNMLIALWYDELIDWKTWNYKYDVQMMKEIETAINSFIEFELNEAVNPIGMTSKAIEPIEKNAEDME